MTDWGGHYAVGCTLLVVELEFVERDGIHLWRNGTNCWLLMASVRLASSGFVVSRLATRLFTAGHLALLLHV